MTLYEKLLEIFPQAKDNPKYLVGNEASLIVGQLGLEIHWYTLEPIDFRYLPKTNSRSIAPMVETKKNVLRLEEGEKVGITFFNKDGITNTTLFNEEVNLSYSKFKGIEYKTKIL